MASGQSGSPLFYTYENIRYTVGVAHTFNDDNNNGIGDLGEPVFGTILIGDFYKRVSDRLKTIESSVDPAQLPQNIIFGGSGTSGDNFKGSHRREKIVLPDGNDVADGYKGDDEIAGGDGNDALFGGKGADTLDGGAGADTLDGGSGDDTLIGGAGADVFVMGKGADRIVNADASDRLYIRVGSLHPFAEERQGGEPLPEDALGLPVRGGFLAGEEEWSIEAALRFPGGFPLFDSGVAYDFVEGTEKAGFYARFNEAFWPETYFYMDGDDLIVGVDLIFTDEVFEITVEDYEPGDLGLELSPYTVNMVTLGDYNGTVRHLFDDGNFTELPVAPLDEETGEDANPGSSPPDTGPYAPTPPYIGGDGDDAATGSPGADSMYGGGGNDSLTAAGGNDTVSGGGGVDTLFYRLSHAGVAVNLALGSGTAGEAAGDQLAGFENVVGSYFGDAITGGADANDIQALDGNDTIDGGAGADTIDGGPGADTISGGDGNDLLLGGTGANFLLGGAGDDVLYGYEDAEYIAGDSGNDFLFGGAGDDILAGGDGNDRAYGQDGKDTLVGEGGDDYLNGVAGDDLIAGNAGNDTIVGDAGNDYMNGGADADTVMGRTGNDTVLGAEGNDYLDGGDGDDLLGGSEGDDILIGDVGNDYLNGGVDNDNIGGGPGNDTVIGDAGNDYLNGGVDNDIIGGGDGNDTVIGDAGDDYLSAGAGDDVLGGGPGKDTLFAGGGSDYLVGGDGDDHFIFDGGFQSSLIIDFTPGPGLSGHDTIQFSTAVFANYADMMAHAQQVATNVVITDASGNTLLLASVNLSSLVADDFSFG